MSDEEITQMAPGLIQAFATQEETEEMEGAVAVTHLQMKQYLHSDLGLQRQIRREYGWTYSNL